MYIINLYINFMKYKIEYIYFQIAERLKKQFLVTSKEEIFYLQKQYYRGIIEKKHKKRQFRHHRK